MRHSAIYAGTFDPITLGHMDLVDRAASIFDEVVLAVVVHSQKDTMFDVTERTAMAAKATADYKNVNIERFDGLLVDFARSRGIHTLIRGLRAYSDFEYEFQMALTNRKLAPDVETLFMMPKETHSYLSSKIVREIIELGGDIAGFVPGYVERVVAESRSQGRPAQ